MLHRSTLELYEIDLNLAIAPDDGDWINTHQHNKGIGEKLLKFLIEQPDNEWLMIDASHCKGVGAKGRYQDMSRTEGGSRQSCMGPWMPTVCRFGHS